MRGVILDKDKFRKFNEQDQYGIFINERAQKINELMIDDERAIISFDFDKFHEELTDKLFITYEYILIDNENKIYGMNYYNQVLLRTYEDSFEYAIRLYFQ